MGWGVLGAHSQFVAHGPLSQGHLMRSLLFSTRVTAPPGLFTPPPPPPPLCHAHLRRRIFDGHAQGVVVANEGTMGRLEGCEVWRNKAAGVEIGAGADPTLLDCE